MHQDKESIKRAVRDGFPFVFGTNESEKFTKFRDRFTEVSEYAQEIASEFLSEGTLRYQSILLYSSLAWVGLHVLELTELNFGGQDVTVSPALIAAFPAFTAALIAVFGTKVFLDYRKHELRLGPGRFSVGDAKRDMQLAQIYSAIDQYFWSTLFTRIGHAYETYAKAQDKAMERARERTPLDVPEVWSIEGLRETQDALKIIADRESWLAGVFEDLETDVDIFEDLAAKALAFYDEDLVHEIDGNEDRFSLQLARQDRVKQAYDETLAKWLDARNDLASEQLEAVINSRDFARAERIVEPLVRARRIRRMTIAVEIAFPVVFAILVQVAYWGGLS